VVIASSLLMTCAILAWRLFRPAPAAKDSPQAENEYVGSRSCRECHETFYRKWVTSRHGTAMQPYTPEFAAANLKPQANAISVQGRDYRFDGSAHRGAVVETGGVSPQVYPIAQVLGGKNVYYFLTPFPKGRLQVLPIAFDARRVEWFSTSQSAVRGHAALSDAPLEWTHRAYTFNTSCFACHVSQLSNHFDPASDSYRTDWLEPGINCETCHGPAGRHVRAARSKSYSMPSDRPDILRFGSLTSEQKNHQCAACHAKLIPLSPDFRAGDNFWNSFDLVTLEHPDYYPDGRDLGENYTYTSWLLSPCTQSGRLDCLHCHTSSGRLRFAENEFDRACLPCHSEIVNRSSEHSRHAKGTRGDRCIDCHMPTTEFARMRRSDHSMLPPAPAASSEFGSPNACTLCHSDRSAKWADDWVRKWYPDDFQSPVVKRGRLIAAARRSDWTLLPGMLDYIQRPGADPIFVASLIRLLGGCEDPRKWDAFRHAAGSVSPLVRSSAVEALAHDATTTSRDTQWVALGDPSRLVRIRAAAALASAEDDSLPPRQRKALANATAEYLTMLQARPDDPAAHADLGNYLLNQGRGQEAAKAFDTALGLSADNLPALVNAGLAWNLAGRNDLAEARLRAALRLQPRNQEALFNLGLLLAEVGRKAEAEKMLRDCLRFHPGNAQAAYNLALLISADRLQEALVFCRKAVAAKAGEPRYEYALALLLGQGGKTDEAIKLLEKLLKRDPANQEARLLLEEIRGRSR